jgi:uncharacterized protein with von Willebrand factor type A (vWA) domain
VAPPAAPTPPLVVLCDISGSMDRYARMLLHFLHAITNDRDRVHVLLFGTRLTNVTRHLKHRDIDVALARVTTAVSDWAGGTRIGSSLEEFNRLWSRRLLGQNAVVLLISDGLEADAGEDLGKQTERLHKSCRRLIWLNPLLRYEGFEARPAGIKADAAARRRLPAGPQLRQPDRARRSAGASAAAQDSIASREPDGTMRAR